MRVVTTSQVPANPVSMPGAEKVSMRLLVGREHGAPNFAMRQFVVEPGGNTPLHQHNYEHEVYITAGKGVVRGKDTYRQVEAGDVVFMPANQLHQFRNTGDEAFSFICLVPVQFDCGNGACQPTPGS